MAATAPVQWPAERDPLRYHTLAKQLHALTEEVHAATCGRPSTTDRESELQQGPWRPERGCTPSEATITCRVYGARARETMPQNACEHFYRCAGCGEIVKLKPRDWPARLF